MYESTALPLHPRLAVQGPIQAVKETRPWVLCYNMFCTRVLCRCAVCGNVGPKLAGPAYFPISALQTSWPSHILMQTRLRFLLGIACTCHQYQRL